jgi:hypothetical protein
MSRDLIARATRQPPYVNFAGDPHGRYVDLGTRRFPEPKLCAITKSNAPPQSTIRWALARRILTWVEG